MEPSRWNKNSLYMTCYFLFIRYHECGCSRFLSVCVRPRASLWEILQIENYCLISSHILSIFRSHPPLLIFSVCLRGIEFGALISICSILYNLQCIICIGLSWSYGWFILSVQLFLLVIVAWLKMILLVFVWTLE